MNDILITPRGTYTTESIVDIGDRLPFSCIEARRGDRIDHIEDTLAGFPLDVQVAILTGALARATTMLEHLVTEEGAKDVFDVRAERDGAQ